MAAPYPERVTEHPPPAPPPGRGLPDDGFTRPSGYPAHWNKEAWPEPPPSKALAGWSLALSIVPCCITWVLAIVFACMVIWRSGDGRDHGRKLSIAALVVAGVWVVALVGAFIALQATHAERDDDGRVTDSGRVLVVDLRVGDCLDTPDADQTALFMSVMPCTEPHNAEVYAHYDLGGEWTTLEEVDRISEAGCLDRFAAYVGAPARKSDLGVFYFIPQSKAQFDEDRSVICILEAVGDVTEPLRGSQR